MHQSMWSNRNGTKYELPSYFSTSQFKTADEWTLMILSTNKDYPNVLNIKAQTKGLSIEQLKSNLAIIWSTEEPANETTEEDLRRQLTEEILEQTGRQKGYKIQDKTKLLGNVVVLSARSATADRGKFLFLNLLIYFILGRGGWSDSYIKSTLPSSKLSYARYYYYKWIFTASITRFWAREGRFYVRI